VELGSLLKKSGRVAPGLTASSSQDHERVDEGVPDQNRITRYQLHPSWHPAGIDQGTEVVLDKSTLIASLPCEMAKPVL
jgi:hypothetical protein